MTTPLPLLGKEGRVTTPLLTKEGSLVLPPSLPRRGRGWCTKNQMTFTPPTCPIFCRGHSGGRLLCEAFIRNQIQMGQVAPDRKDTEFFSIHHPSLRQLILNAYHYLTATPEDKSHYQYLMKTYINEYYHTEIHSPGPYGWKMGITLFTLPLVLDTFPHTKVIHLIRDGRDVMLSRLEARFGGNNLSDPVNKLVVFGDPNTDHFAGPPLTPTSIARYRNELEMQHWVTAVRYGLQGRAYPDRYLEIKYENLCQAPLNIFNQIFEFIDIPLLNSTKDWIIQTTHPIRIGKWKQLSAAQLEKPLQIGGKLLEELGYK